MCNAPEKHEAHAHRRDFMLGAALVIGAAGAGAAQAQQGAARVWMCPPCGCASDGKEFAAPGACPSCGMQLIEAKPGVAPKPRTKVAILLFPGVQIIDFTGPYEVFGQAGYEVFTVAAKKAPLQTAMLLDVTPAYAFGESPKPDVLLIPGGNIGSAMHDKATLDWIRAQSAQSQMTMSVCNGALILANTGLLDGLTATTFHGAVDDLITEFPKVKVVYDKRFVDNGKFVTTAGLSSGIDGAMHIVSRLEGKVDAELVARNLEYNWDEETKYARAALADYPIRGAFGSRLILGLPAADYVTKVESSAGDRSKWEAVWRIETANPAAVVAEAIEASVASRLGAIKAEKVSKPSTQRTWKFTDPRGRSWGVRLDVSDTATSGVKRARMTSMLVK
jgi:putative intracellular protease/amidase